jgi:hypothetical protein
MEEKVKQLINKMDEDYCETLKDSKESYGDEGYERACGARLCCLSQYIRELRSLVYTK